MLFMGFVLTVLKELKLRVMDTRVSIPKKVSKYHFSDFI